MDIDDLAWLGLAYLFLRAFDPVKNAITQYERAHPFGPLGPTPRNSPPGSRGLQPSTPMVDVRVANRVRELAEKVGFPDPQLAMAIALAESSGRERVINHNPPREHSVGLWQINTLAHPQYSEADMLDAEKNARAAYELSRGGTNWSAWGAYTDGRYKAYL